MTKTSLSTFYYWLLSMLISILAVGVIGYKWDTVKPNYQHSVFKTIGNKEEPNSVEPNLTRNGFPIIRNNAEHQSGDPDSDKNVFTIIANKDDLDIVKHSSKSIQCIDAPLELIEVPVGFFIQSFSFVNANDVNFVGYIWMKFPPRYQNLGYKKSFIFPEEVNSNTTKTKPIYRKKLHDGTVLKGWYFDVIVRENYDYSKYPLDFQTAWLRLWSKDFVNDEHIIFVPDFDSYVPKDPHKMPSGLDKDINSYGHRERTKKFSDLDDDIVPGGWKIEDTFYSIKDQKYNTSFGFRKAEKCRTYWEMYYNIKIERILVDALVTDLVPLFFTTILLFTLLMSVSSESTRKERFGFNTINTIAICASLLFIVVLLHIQIRQQFAGSKLVYIEYFYIITYLMILFTTLNSYTITINKHRTIAFLFWRDNLLPKILYWPLLLWMMAIITLIKI